MRNRPENHDLGTRKPAASWFTGNNVAGETMYASQTGRGYDGISGPNAVNKNAGAESTIEALFTVLEMERIPDARTWMQAEAGPREVAVREGKNLVYRLFSTKTDQIAVVLNLDDRNLQIIEGAALADFLNE